MRAVMLAKHNTEYTSEVEDWMRDFKSEMRLDIEWLDPDEIDGEIFATAHDILEYPAVVVTDQNSSVLRKWTGKKLPQFEDVAYVLRSAV